MSRKLLIVTTIIAGLGLFSCTEVSPKLETGAGQHSVADSPTIPGATNSPYPTYTPYVTSADDSQGTSKQVEVNAETSPLLVSATEKSAVMDVDHILWENFVHPVSGISFDYPADWAVIVESEVVLVEGDRAHIVIEDIASRNDEVGLEQVVTDMFELDRDYIEDSGTKLSEPAGYMSTGRFVSDNSQTIRFLIDHLGYGLIHWMLRTSENIVSDEHIFVIENMMVSLVLPRSETKVVETNMNTDMEMDDDSWCAIYTNSDLRIFEVPENTITRRCKVELGNIVFDFNGYEGVDELLYEDVVEAIFTAAELFPIPLDTFDGVGLVMVPVWHRSKSDTMEVAQHRCSYMMPGLGERCWSDFMRPGGIAMAKMSDDPILFEIAFPTADTHIDQDVTHWLPAAHEWTHAYQRSHVINSRPPAMEGPGEVPLAGPVWLDEGIADFLGLLMADHVGATDFIDGFVDWFRQTNTEYENRDNIDGTNNGVPGSDVLSNCSTPLDQVEAEESGNAWQCPAGRVAVMVLLDLGGPEPVNRIKNYYKDLVEFGWRESFVRSFGRTPDAFYEEFGEFLEQPSEQQESIISKPIFLSP